VNVGPRRPRSAGIAVAAVTLLLVLLPALVVGSSLAAPARPGEAARLQRALSSAESAAVPDGEVARSFHRSAVMTATWPQASAEQEALLARARLAQVAAIAGLSGLLYLVVLLARGRLQALLACLCLSVLPPVASGGHVLRPEAPAALFAALALLLLQMLAAEPVVEAAGSRMRRSLLPLAVGGCALLANGMAVAALPSRGEVLLVPGIVLTIAGVQIAWRGAQVWRRRGWLRLPVPAINGRLLPWTALSLLSPVAALVVLSAALSGPSEALAPTAAGDGLLPTGLAHWPVLVLAAIGALVGVLRVGIGLGRRGRIGADFVLYVFTVAVLAGVLRAPPGEDALPAALPLAVLVAEGLRAVAVALRGRRRAGPGVTT
jgi:hypothetical protein